MSTVPLSELKDRIATPAVRKGANAQGLIVNESPTPFVHPELSFLDGGADVLDTEVITIQAPAAVGKSITARYLAAESQCPFLDMATVAVGHHSLAGILADFCLNSQTGTKAFHQGMLPIIIDAVDEGVLLCGEDAVEQFVRGIVSFITRDRGVTNRPKVVLFGRDEYVDWTNIFIEDEDINEGTSSVTVCNARLDFFARESAYKLVPLYARQELRKLPQGAERQRKTAQLRSKQTTDLVEAYFATIASALDLDSNDLWNDARGRAFAGYAPTLAALGKSLAAVGNVYQATQELRNNAGKTAWDVIGTVIEHVMLREQNDKMAPQLTYEVAPAPYRPEEQLRYLAQRYGGSIELDPSLKFPGGLGDRDDYRQKVQDLIVAHPFVPEDGSASDVLESKVMAYALANSMLGEEHEEVVRRLSRQPFLWRWFAKQIASEADDELLVDGTHLGYILASYWNDPIEPDGGHVAITETADDNISAVSINEGRPGQVTFRTLDGIVLYDKIKNCTVNVTNQRVKLVGAALGQAGYFRFQGGNRLDCGTLEYACEFSSLEGSLWLNAMHEVIVGVNQPRLTVEKGARYAWGRTVRTRRPWRDLLDTDEDLLPRVPEQGHEVLRLIDACMDFQPEGMALFVRERNYMPGSDRDLPMSIRVFGSKFGSFLRVLVRFNIAEKEVQGSSGDTSQDRTIKIRLPSQGRWSELRQAVEDYVRGDPVEEALQKFAEEAAGLTG